MFASFVVFNDKTYCGICPDELRIAHEWVQDVAKKQS
jgi:hypothetical protein